MLSACICVYREVQNGLTSTGKYLLLCQLLDLLQGYAAVEKSTEKNTSFKWLPFINLPGETGVVEARETGTVYSDWVRHLDILT